MGMNKALMNYQGEPWLLFQLRQLLELDLQNILLVTNPETQALVQNVIEKSGQRVLLLVNPHPEKGPFSSLRLALAAAPESSSFVCPVDVPLKAPTLKEMRQAWLSNSQLEALIPSYKGQKGHPVLLSSELQRRLLQLPEESPQARLDVALNAIAENKKKVLEIEDPFITMNLNTQNDLTALS